MADTKISGATDGVTFNATDKIPLARSGSTSKLWATGTYVQAFLTGIANTWSLAQTFTNSTIKLLGSSTGATTFTSDNAGASNFIIHVPAANDTLAILGTAETFTAAQRGALSTLTDAGTIALDLSLANNYKVVLGGARTLGVPTNPVAGQTGIIDVWQDITGSRTLAYTWPYIFPGGTAPTLSTGKLVSDELYYYVRSYSTSTVTVTSATPAVVTWTTHGLNSGNRVQFTNSGGALPTGISAATTYWVTVINANTFNISTSLANAQAATFVNTSDTGTGTHTATQFSIVISNNLGLA